ncbi:MAG: cytochrome P450 [Acidimicrobiia bacterium]
MAELDSDPRGDIFVNPERWGDMTDWHEVAAELRRDAPVLEVVAEGWEPFRAVMTHADVREISRRSVDVFRNTERSAPAPNLVYDMLDLTGFPYPKTLVHMHGKEHQDHRQVTNDWFKPAAVSEWQPTIDRIADQFVDRLAEHGGECDFAQDIAAQYTLHVIMGIFGVPESDERLMLELTQGLFGSADPEYIGDFDAPVDMLSSTLQKFGAYFDELTADRRAHPTGDLATVIANGEIDGHHLADDARLWYYIIVATAGHDTTSYGMSGGLEALLRNPDQLAAVWDEPGLISPATEEMLRWVSPVRAFFRWPTEDYELPSGYVLPKDEAVLTSYPSANRDEQVFAHSMTFDIHRTDVDNLLTFGLGAHFCLGAQFARREIRTMLGKLRQRVASIELAGEPEWTASSFVSGVKHLPIRYTLR